ncbi:MAG: DUF262 domain-containing protein [Bacteroidaceae bacterium]|nr:DUF262 domain-containing protein [Bacteroidaceae bacterium]
MNNVLTQYTQVPSNLFALLSRYRVIIPGIQRHYVQGANKPEAKSIRENFINEIFDVIEEKEKRLNLHFIYGPINTDGEDSFVPVDGQQRLTTLWLIARYATEKVLEESSRKDILALLARFSYADRIHATRFCQALSSVDSHWNISKNPMKDITGQSWFWDYWTEDETVSSMLRMLSTIHEVWEKRKPNSCQVLEALAERISFELKIDNFGDDIYMKMNARGLQLTQWENFKCKFADELGNFGEACKQNWDKEIEKLSNDFFENKPELPDNSLFALLARIFVYVGKEQCNEAICQLARFTHRTWEKIELPFVPYSNFLSIIRSGINLKDIADTVLLMTGRIIGNATKKVPYFGDKCLFDTFFHPRNINELDFSICCFEYFTKYKNVTDEEFLQAMRLIWNILENTDEGKKPYSRVAIIKKFIDLDSPTLYSPNANKITDDAKQIEEEKQKSIKIYDLNQECPNDWDEKELGSWNGWKTAIELAESEAFFNGSIRFLIYDEEGQPTWNNFATKLINCRKVFCDQGLKEGKEKITNQVLISHCKSWNIIRNRPIFDKGKDSWKRLLTSRQLIYAINNMLLNPFTIADVVPAINADKEIIKKLLTDEIWENLINKAEGYIVDYYNNVPSLWLKRYPSLTLTLLRENREDILDEFNTRYKEYIQFELEDSDRFLHLNGTNHYYAIPVFFVYLYRGKIISLHGKKYRFAWQTWGWIDMYDDKKRLYDLYFAKYNKGFNIPIEADTNAEGFIQQLNEIIERYEDFLIHTLNN